MANITYKEWAFITGIGGMGCFLALPYFEMSQSAKMITIISGIVLLVLCLRCLEYRRRLMLVNTLPGEIRSQLYKLDKIIDGTRWIGKDSEIIYYGNSYFIADPHSNKERQHAGIEQQVLCRTAKGNWFIAVIQIFSIGGTAYSFSILETGEAAAQRFVSQYSIKDATQIFNNIETA